MYILLLRVVGGLCLLQVIFLMVGRANRVGLSLDAVADLAPAVCMCGGRDCTGESFRGANTDGDSCLFVWRT